MTKIGERPLGTPANLFALEIAGRFPFISLVPQVSCLTETPFRYES